MTVEQQWPELVALKPRYAAVVAAVGEGDDTLYKLAKRFGSLSVHGVLKDLVDKGILSVKDGVGKTSRPTKVYALTDLGRRLAPVLQRDA